MYTIILLLIISLSLALPVFANFRLEDVVTLHKHQSVNQKLISAGSTVFLPNSKQCIRLCWYSSACAAVSYDTKEMNCRLYDVKSHKSVFSGLVMRVGEVVADMLNVGMNQDPASGCMQRPCSEDSMCVPSWRDNTSRTFDCLQADLWSLSASPTVPTAYATSVNELPTTAYATTAESSEATTNSAGTHAHTMTATTSILTTVNPTSTKSSEATTESAHSHARTSISSSTAPATAKPTSTSSSATTADSTHTRALMSILSSAVSTTANAVSASASLVPTSSARTDAQTNAAPATSASSLPTTANTLSTDSSEATATSTNTHAQTTSTSTMEPTTTAATTTATSAQTSTASTHTYAQSSISSTSARATANASPASSSGGSTTTSARTHGQVNNSTYSSAPATPDAITANSSAASTSSTHTSHTQAGVTTPINALAPKAGNATSANSAEVTANFSNTLTQTNNSHSTSSLSPTAPSTTSTSSPFVSSKSTHTHPQTRVSNTSSNPTSTTAAPTTNCTQASLNIPNGTILTWNTDGKSGEFTCDPLFDLYPDSGHNWYGEFWCVTSPPTISPPESSWHLSAQCKQQEFLDFTAPLTANIYSTVDLSYNWGICFDAYVPQYGNRFTISVFAGNSTAEVLRLDAYISSHSVWLGAASDASDVTTFTRSPIAGQPFLFLPLKEFELDFRVVGAFSIQVQVRNREEIIDDYAQFPTHTDVTEISSIKVAGDLYVFAMEIGCY